MDENSGVSDAKLLTTEVALLRTFQRHIFKNNGLIKTMIESETDTKIGYCPNNRNAIAITYKNESSLIALHKKLKSITAHVRKKMHPTHFVSIPVHSEEILGNLKKFQDLCADIIHPHRVQYPSKLHITIGVLKLLSDEEIQQACTALSEFAAMIPSIIGDKPLHGTLKNLRTMRSDAWSAKVVCSEFILSDGSERLQELADKCMGFFVEKGLMEYEFGRKSVLLHCTLINTRWNKSGPRTIDASGILSDEFQLRSLGNCVLSRMDLNEMRLDSSFTSEKDCRYVKVSDIAICG